MALGGQGKAVLLLPLTPAGISPPYFAMSTALLFSGQGAQVVGMGKSLFEGSNTARDLYNRANKVLPFDLQKVCFEGPAEVLTETRVCQPALYVQGFAIAQILRERGKLNNLTACLGLSLGELTAYAVAGVWDFETGLKIVAERGRLMQLACDQTKGGMAAVIGGSREDIAKLCAAFDIDAANFNCPGQVVISGDNEKVTAAVARAKEFGPFKLVKPLVVAGAYHSRLMEPARKEFEKWAVLTYSNNRAIINPKKGADKGIDGIAYFRSEQDEPEKIILQVKSGNIKSGDIRDLQGTLTLEKAAMGIFITLKEPTKEMIKTAKSAGIYQNKYMSQSYDIISIVTIQEIIEEQKQLSIPLGYEVLKSAEKQKEIKPTQLSLLDIDITS